MQTTAQQPDQVFLLDQQGICQDYLTEDVTQDGKLRQEHLGRSLAELVPADLANQIYARLQKVFTERKSQTLEYSSVVGDQVRYAEAASASYASQGTETIFVVEDDEQIRALASFILQEQGYTVLVAANGAEALQIADEHPHPIDLLLTDVIMPGMSGRQLSNELTAVRPNLKVLFVSGYTRFEIAAYGVLDSGIAFLPKPYTPDLLAQRVRELLDQG
ncbi:MAG: response regulator [Caldilineaceae bacterium]